MEEGRSPFVRVKITGGHCAGREGVIRGTFSREWLAKVKGDDLGDQVVVYDRYDPSAKPPFVNWIDRVLVSCLEVL